MLETLLSKENNTLKMKHNHKFYDELCVTLFLVLLGLVLTAYIHPLTNPFLERDPTLSYEFIPHSKQRVPTEILAVISLAVPIAIVGMYKIHLVSSGMKLTHITSKSKILTSVYV